MFRTRMLSLAAVALLTVLGFAAFAPSQVPNRLEAAQTTPTVAPADGAFNEFVKIMNALDEDTSKIRRGTYEGTEVFTCALNVTHGSVKHRVWIYYLPAKKEMGIQVILTDRLTPQEEAALKTQVESHNSRQDKKAELVLSPVLHNLSIGIPVEGNITTVDVQTKLNEVLAGVDQTQHIWASHRK
jgi:hypothetical protein